MTPASREREAGVVCWERSLLGPAQRVNRCDATEVEGLVVGLTAYPPVRANP